MASPDLKYGSQNIHAECFAHGRIRKVEASGTSKTSPAPAIPPSIPGSDDQTGNTVLCAVPLNSNVDGTAIPVVNTESNAPTTIVLPRRVRDRRTQYRSFLPPDRRLFLCVRVGLNLQAHRVAQHIGHHD